VGKERALHEFRDASADHFLHARQLKGGKAMLAKRQIKGLSDVGRAIDQRPVKVEDDCARPNPVVHRHCDALYFKLRG
jgi:hypothetical protein